MKPNRTLNNMTRKWILLGTNAHVTRLAAETEAEAIRSNGFMARITKLRVGSRAHPDYRYVVRGYSRRSKESC